MDTSSHAGELGPFVQLVFDIDLLGREFTEDEGRKLAHSLTARLAALVEEISQGSVAVKVRYYAVGEYGDETERPHYHLVVFGLQTCARGRTSQRAITEMGSCCSICNLVSSTWGKGRVEVLPFSRELSNYIAGYVTKKLSQKDHPWLRGRHPEFVRQSKQDGGLGIGMVPEIASVLLQYDHEKDLEDVPIALAHGEVHAFGPISPP